MESRRRGRPQGDDDEDEESMDGERKQWQEKATGRTTMTREGDRENDDAERREEREGRVHER
ncbi:unnamed protein product [Malus baccata var. baccata]